MRRNEVDSVVLFGVGRPKKCGAHVRRHLQFSEVGKTSCEPIIEDDNNYYYILEINNTNIGDIYEPSLSSFTNLQI